MKGTAAAVFGIALFLLALVGFVLWSSESAPLRPLSAGASIATVTTCVGGSTFGGGGDAGGACIITNINTTASVCLAPAQLQLALSHICAQPAKLGLATFTGVGVEPDPDTDALNGGNEVGQGDTLAGLQQPQLVDPDTEFVPANSSAALLDRPRSVGASAQRSTLWPYPTPLAPGFSGPPGDPLSVEALPLRKFGVWSYDTTSYNPLGANADFGNFIRVEGRVVVMAEAAGSGCIHRWFFGFSWFNHSDSVLVAQTAHVVVFLDGQVVVNVSTRALATGEVYPFLYPLSTQHSFNGGFASYFPLCFRASMKVGYWSPKWRPPKNLLKQMQQCLSKNTRCPMVLYWSVGYHLYATDTGHATYDANAQLTKESVEQHRKVLELVGVPGTPPSPMNRPNNGTAFQERQLMGHGRGAVLWKHAGPGVIAGLWFHLNINGHSPRSWDGVRLTIAFDDAEPAQVEDIPLGEFFGSASSIYETRQGGLRRARGVMLGFLRLPVESPSLEPGPRWVGYCYYPMPFWRSATISLTWYRSVKVLYKVHVVPNNYPERHTAYFHAWYHKQWPSVVGFPHDFLRVRRGWGHYVGLNWRMGSKAWLRLEGDCRMNWDHSGVFNYLGTGTEDYFNIAKLFRFSIGKVYPFFGNTWRDRWGSPRPEIRAYRQLVTDFVPFHDGISAFFETASRSGWNPNDLNFLQTNISTVAFYYLKPVSGLSLIDEIDVGDSASERDHLFRLVQRATPESPLRLPPVETVTTTRFTRNDNVVPYSENLREFQSGDVIQFLLHGVRTPNYGIELRRRFDWMVPDQTAEVVLDQEVVGLWHHPQENPFARFYESTFIIPPSFTNQAPSLLVTLRVKSKSWRMAYMWAFVVV
eukprot:TRINITY_DN14092_c0_g1_i1.p1 TRINITY_DN14092_c0_g1~~TRINITY_DN14092_c0_g1_i1.p1  ORF type:complete len:866 (+),score=119.10 TRINITY_DN14092_c0_g1_i1:66-2663(+)